MKALHFVLPESVDDPTRPSGGNAYDRHVCRGLSSLGWAVHEHAVRGRWPERDGASLAALGEVVGQIPDGAAVLVDGLVASAAPDALVPQASRLRLVVLVHMPLGHRPPDHAIDDARRREGAVLSAAAALITTSAWSRRRLLELYRLPAGRVHVAAPGVDTAALAPGTAEGRALLCVAAVRYEKGHDVLFEALKTISDQLWQCVCVGSLDRDPRFVECLRRRILDAGMDDRMSFLGPRTGPDLDRLYAAADLMVLASRAETYGMVVTEALARGLPVVAAEVGGLSEALGYGADGTRPGILVAPEDPVALGVGLRSWLGDAELRQRLRRAARERRETLTDWSTTTAALATALDSLSP